jgi:hypothetical protein
MGETLGGHLRLATQLAVWTAAITTTFWVAYDLSTRLAIDEAA